MNLTILSSMFFIQIAGVIFYLFALPFVLRWVVGWLGGKISYGRALLILLLAGVLSSFVNWFLLLLNLGKAGIVIGYIISYFIFSYIFNRFSDLINPLPLRQTIFIYMAYVVLSFLLWLPASSPFYFGAKYLQSGFPCTIQRKITFTLPYDLIGDLEYKSTLNGTITTLKSTCRSVVSESSTKPVIVPYVVERTPTTFSLTLLPQYGGERTEYKVRESAFTLHEEKPLGSRGCRYAEDTNGILGKDNIGLTLNTEYLGTYEQCRAIKTF